MKRSVSAPPDKARCSSIDWLEWTLVSCILHAASNIQPQRAPQRPAQHEQSPASLDKVTIVVGIDVFGTAVISIALIVVAFVPPPVEASLGPTEIDQRFQAETGTDVRQGHPHEQPAVAPGGSNPLGDHAKAVRHGSVVDQMRTSTVGPSPLRVHQG